MIGKLKDGHRYSIIRVYASIGRNSLTRCWCPLRSSKRAPTCTSARFPAAIRRAVTSSGAVPARSVLHPNPYIQYSRHIHCTLSAWGLEAVQPLFFSLWFLLFLSHFNSLPLVTRSPQRYDATRIKSNIYPPFIGEQEYRTKAIIQTQKKQKKNIFLKVEKYI